MLSGSEPGERRAHDHPMKQELQDVHLASHSRVTSHRAGTLHPWMIAMLLNEIRLLQDEDSDWCSRGIRSQRVSMVGNDVLRNSSFDQSLSMEAVKCIAEALHLRACEF